MSWNPFQKLFPSKKFLGIDIGTSCLKIVEISQSADKQKLENYGFISTGAFVKKSFRDFEEKNILFFTQDIVEGIKSIIQESGIKTKKAIFSIPDFSTFFTNFELPPMKREELEKAIQYEAKQHIPLPLKEIFLDWQIIKGNVLDQVRGRDSNEKEKLKILLVAVSNRIIRQYQEIATLADLELVSLEAEVFSLMRALIKEDEKKVIALIEIGAKTTTCSIVDEGKLENSYSFNMSSNEFSSIIAEKFNLSFLEAEELKKKYGLLDNGVDGKNFRSILLPLVDLILLEIQKIFDNFSRKEGREVEKVVLAGGAVLLPGFKEYLQVRLKKEVVVSQPFLGFDYPLVLEERLREIGPSYAIAVGAALRGLHGK